MSYEPRVRWELGQKPTCLAAGGAPSTHPFWTGLNLSDT